MSIGNHTLSSRCKADWIYSNIGVTLIEQLQVFLYLKNNQTKNLKNKVGIQAIKRTETRDE